MKQATTSNIHSSWFREEAETYCYETIGHDSRRPLEGKVRIRSMAELCTKPAVLIRNLYFEGGDVMRCYEGRFRLQLEGRPSIDIAAGETLVIYPEQRVTIESLDRKNVMLYVIFEGEGVAEYFDRLGFFDGLHGKTSTQREVFDQIKNSLAHNDGILTPDMFSLMSDALTTYAHDFRTTGNCFVFRAIRQIKENLARRIVRLDPLCGQLNVSHTYLDRMFVQSGIGSPSEFIRREQLRLAVRLLKETELPVSQVAETAGFISFSHFANFIKRYTGKTARAIRVGC